MTPLPGLYGKGGAVPPVSPEVIHILLLQRSSRLPDGPSEHVFAMEFFCEGKLSGIHTLQLLQCYMALLRALWIIQFGKPG